MTIAQWAHRYMTTVFEGLPIALAVKGSAHSFQVAQLSALLAHKRGLDAQIAYVIGALHDIACPV